MGILGLIVFILIAWLLSSHKHKISWSVVGWGLGLQLLLALLILGIPSMGFDGPLAFVFAAANDVIIAVLNYTAEGSKFIFGSLLDVPKSGFIFAFQVLPTIIFMATLMSVLYHLGVMQVVIKGVAFVMQRTMKISGAESLSVASNIFVGQTEAPLVVKPYVTRMTQSELLAVMIGGMATVAGGVMAAYVGLLKDRIPDIAGHLLTASVMSAPAAMLIAKLLLPETEKPETLGKVPKLSEEKKGNVIEAAASGASEGLGLSLNVAAMLLAFIALVALVNGVLGWVGQGIGFDSWGSGLALQPLAEGQSVQLSLQLILGWIFMPLAWLMGIPFSEAGLAGSMLGEKIVLNEFVAYLSLSGAAESLSDRSVVILSYALCGFANFSSIAIQIAGIGGIAPKRKSDLAALGIKSVIGGSLAAFMTASIAGLLV